MPSRMGRWVQGFPALTYFGDLVWQDAFWDAKGTANMLVCTRFSLDKPNIPYTCLYAHQDVYPVQSVTILGRIVWTSFSLA